LHFALPLPFPRLLLPSSHKDTSSDGDSFSQPAVMTPEAAPLHLECQEPTESSFLISLLITELELSRIRNEPN
jgi:hypothetical protein